MCSPRMFKCNERKKARENVRKKGRKKGDNLHDVSNSISLEK